MLVDPTENNERAISVLYEAGGGLATAFKIDSYRTMSIDQFKEQIVPTLKSTPAEGRFSYYILRDFSNNRYLTIYPDGVVEYNVESVQEVPASTLIEELLKIAQKDTCVQTKIINSSLPVYEYGEDSLGSWKMSVKIPETRFKFKNTSLYANEADYPYIYMPPVIYTVEASKNNVIRNTWVKVLVQDSFDAAKCKFGHLTLPNIYHSTKICRGRTYLQENEDPSTMSKMRIVASSWDLFINSLWNFDLLAEKPFPVNLDEVFNSIENPSEHYKDYGHFECQALCKLVEVLKEEGRWEQLQWVPL